MEPPRQECPGCRALERRVRELERRLDEAVRASKRQAAPFSKGAPKDEPKRCGRKPNDGRGWFRRAAPRRPDEMLDAPLPCACPACGGRVREVEVVEQLQTEVPKMEPRVTRFDVHVGRCESCGSRVQGRHPRQASTALGAAGHHLGPNAMAMASYLQKVGGLSHGKIADFFEVAFSLTTGPSTWVRGILRAGRRLAPTYHRIEVIVRASRVVSSDETGWKVGGLLQWLWVFATPLFCLYRIRPSRGFDVPSDVLGADYAGYLNHDGWAPYGRFEKAIHQTCVAHLLRRAHLLLEEATRGAVRFPRAVRGILKDALALRDRHEAGEVSDHGLAVAWGRLSSRIEALGNWRLSNDENRKFRKHLMNHQDEILTFLRAPEVPATNHLAERAIRPAVVNRKVWGGNRTENGAAAQEILASVLRTCRLQGIEPIRFLREMLSISPDPATVPAWALGP